METECNVPEVRIRPFKEPDREAILHITVTCFDGVSIDRNIEAQCGVVGGRDWRWRKSRDVAQDLEVNPGGVLVAEDDGGVIGYITTRIDRESRIGSIPNLAVDPWRQKHGLGRRLIAAALRYLAESGMQYARIETLEQNPVGQHLYPKMGFREVARQIHYIAELPLEPESPSDSQS